MAIEPRPTNGELVESASTLRAGVSRQFLVAPVGIRLAGALRDADSVSVHQELTASALYLAEGDISILILACDLIVLLPEDADRIREVVSTEVAVPSENILLSVSHTHATPSPPGWREYDYEASNEDRRRIEVFFEELTSRLVQAAMEAKASASPARTGAASGSSDININRREQRADGTMVLGANPDGPVDRQVAVVRIDRERDQHPLAMIFNYACHPDVLGPKSQLISPDFVGPARETAEMVTQATSLFLQGAAGDIYPCTGIVNGADGVSAATRLGRRLGAEASRVFETISLHRRPARRAEWVSTASITTSWHYDSVLPTQGQQLDIRRSVQDLPLRTLPSEADAVALVERRRALLGELDNSQPLSKRLIAHRRLTWSELQLRAIRDQAPMTVPVEIQAIRIGEAAIVAIPGELFTEIGLAIKATSPFPTTLVSAYSNGVYFYIPTKAAFDQGGYEINSHQNYMRHSGPTMDWERRLLDEAGGLLAQLRRSENHTQR